MKILIATGIYPPELGGPAEYAKNLGDLWRSHSHAVDIRVFSRFNNLPTGLRHLAYFLYILPAVMRADWILALDTYSAALPTVLAAKFFGKKIVVRTGGDFLWESYVERTGDLVLLREFYQSRQKQFSIKERIIFYITRFVLKSVGAIVWSTEWQKDIFMKPYDLAKQKHFIIENYYGSKLPSKEPKEKSFLAMTRSLKWKNLGRVRSVFGNSDIMGASLDTVPVPHDTFLEKLASSYAVILASLGDISPNMILDALRYDKPFILTKETGLYGRLKHIALFVDPENEQDIKDKVNWLLDPINYEAKRRQLASFTFTHTWEEMAAEYVEVWKRI